MGTMSRVEPLAEERAERVAVDVADLWCVSTGEGPGVVLAHGGPGMSDNLAPVARLVEDLVRVHRYDQRACGRSSGEAAGQTVESAVADLDALRAHWGYDRWVVGGHSWGAALALFYAVRHPERTRGVIYLSGPGVTRIERPSALPRLERMTADEREQLPRLESAARAGDADAARRLAHIIWRTDFADPGKAPDFTQHPLFAFPRNPAVSDELRRSADAELTSGLADKVSRLTVPVLFVHGRQDPLPVEAAVDLAHRLPSASLHIVEDAGHIPWMEDLPSVRRALRDWLTGLQS